MKFLSFVVATAIVLRTEDEGSSLLEGEFSNDQKAIQTTRDGNVPGSIEEEGTSLVDDDEKTQLLSEDEKKMARDDEKMDELSKELAQLKANVVAWGEEQLMPKVPRQSKLTKEQPAEFNKKTSLEKLPKLLEEREGGLQGLETKSEQLLGGASELAKMSKLLLQKHEKNDEKKKKRFWVKKKKSKEEEVPQEEQLDEELDEAAAAAGAVKKKKNFADVIKDVKETGKAIVKDVKEIGKAGKEIGKEIGKDVKEAGRR
eukprot:GEMP01044474.1.p1 GENE.GEMP01044474.1~~GEMP01044474.1.p1  ORF type:complete len:258 (+),score=75.13 GEMP01044474.1:225-998(+)